MNIISRLSSLTLLAGSVLVSVSAFAAAPSPIPEAELHRPPLTAEQAGYCGMLMDRLAQEDARQLLDTAKKLSAEEQQAQLFVLTAKVSGRPVLEQVYKEKVSDAKLAEFKDTIAESSAAHRNSEFTWCAERAAAAANELSASEKEALKERVAGALMTTLSNTLQHVK